MIQSCSFNELIICFLFWKIVSVGHYIVPLFFMSIIFIHLIFLYILKK